MARGLEQGSREAFERKAKSLLKQVERYSSEGGDISDDAANKKIERSFWRARDRLYDAERYLDESARKSVEPLFLRVRKAISDAPGLASEARVKLRNFKLRELKEEAMLIRLTPTTKGN